MFALIYSRQSWAYCALYDQRDRNPTLPHALADLPSWKGSNCIPISRCIRSPFPQYSLFALLFSQAREHERSRDGRGWSERRLETVQLEETASSPHIARSLVALIDETVGEYERVRRRQRRRGSGELDQQWEEGGKQSAKQLGGILLLERVLSILTTLWCLSLVLFERNDCSLRLLNSCEMVLFELFLKMLMCRKYSQTKELTWIIFCTTTGTSIDLSPNTCPKIGLRNVLD